VPNLVLLPGPDGFQRYFKLQDSGFKEMRTTYMPKESEIERKWYVIDATGVPLGRLASEVARILKGKHKPTYTPHVDMGDHVVVINASRVVLTGKKPEQKIYYRHSGYPGGIKSLSYKELLERNPERAVFLAVKRMLPSSRLGRRMQKKLRVYAGPDHSHAAQRPEKIEYNPKRVT